MAQVVLSGTIESFKSKAGSRAAAEKIAEANFPEDISVELIHEFGKDSFIMEIDDKGINDSKGWHQLWFRYEFTHESYLKMRKLTEKYKKEFEDDDEEGEKETLLGEQLATFDFTVYVELRKVDGIVIGEVS